MSSPKVSHAFSAGSPLPLLDSHERTVMLDTFVTVCMYRQIKKEVLDLSKRIDIWQEYDAKHQKGETP